MACGKVVGSALPDCAVATRLEPPVLILCQKNCPLPRAGICRGAMVAGVRATPVRPMSAKPSNRAMALLADPMPRNRLTRVVRGSEQGD